MDAQWKTKWVEALRSGNYEQGKDSLREGDQFCCLGVLTDLVIKETADAEWRDGRPALEDALYGLGTLPEFVIEEVVLHQADPMIKGEHLSVWNDTHGATFEKIADLIEEGL